MPKHVDEPPNYASHPKWKTLSTRHSLGTSRPEHSHSTGQLLFAISGVMLVESGSTSWIIPPQRALWIPPNRLHALKFLSDTDLRTVYFSVSLIGQCPIFIRANDVHVVETTNIVKELVSKIFDSARKETAELSALLLLHVLSETETLPTDVPMPVNERLKYIAKEILDNNAWELPVSTLAQMATMSERTLSRKFQEDTGMSLRSWKQRARICVSLNLLAAGKGVKQVAGDLGFSGPAAYIAAFKGVLGRTPAEFTLYEPLGSDTE